MTASARSLPFGAELVDGTNTRFRLWAPDARSVSLLIEEGPSVPMEYASGGWFSTIATAPAGTLYRYLVDDKLHIPDPASRFNPQDVFGPSEVIDPKSYIWQDDGWQGRPWEEAVVCELHLGTFSEEGHCLGAIKHLDHLVETGITAIEIMPVADFPGKRNWGYDGVLPYAPDHAYGRPEDLKKLVDTAHQKGLSVILDVVCNHFGPSGNFLSQYAKAFFSERHRTPWGPAINFDGPMSETVRRFFIENALYWLEEYHFDGLRLDAVHAILDDSSPSFIEELEERAGKRFALQKRVHLILENDANEARFLKPSADKPLPSLAQWNDDLHHALHVILTGETDGYYADYAPEPEKHLGRCLAEGFAYQGEFSPYRGKKRGEKSGDLPLGAFVSFLQTHDQIGNRPRGERLQALCDEKWLYAAMSLLLLCPHIPMLFMGEEFLADTPFCYFCDHEQELMEKIRKGRQEEFQKFRSWGAEDTSSLPDPGGEDTFLSSRLRWKSLLEPRHQAFHAFVKALLRLRKERIAPLIPQVIPGKSSFRPLGPGAVEALWPTPSGKLRLLANLGKEALSFSWQGEPFFSFPKGGEKTNLLAPSVLWFLEG